MYFRSTPSRKEKCVPIFGFSFWIVTHLGLAGMDIYLCVTLVAEPPAGGPEGVEDPKLILSDKNNSIPVFK